MKFFALALLLLLVGCNPDNVQFDKDSPGFVDPQTNAGIDQGLPKTTDAVLNETHKDFVPPPDAANITYNGDVQAAELPAPLRGRSVVTLWVWNELGSQRLIVSEGMGAGVSRLKVTVDVGAVSSDDGGKAVISVNGQQGRIMREREETRFGNTYVFVSEIIAVR